MHSIGKLIYEKAIDINIQKNPDDTKQENIETLKEKGFTVVDDRHLLFSESDLVEVDLESMWDTFVKKITPQNEREVKVVEYLRLLPAIEEYKKYFNLNRYYEKR